MSYSTINGKKIESSWAGSADNLKDFIKLIEAAPETLEYIKNKNKNYFQINDVVEKPSINDAPSNKAVIGRYILPVKIFSKLKNLKPSKGGEIHITDAIQLLINDNEKFIAHNFSGKYLDCGSMEGYINSSKEIAKL